MQVLSMSRLTWVGFAFLLLSHGSASNAAGGGAGASHRRPELATLEGSSTARQSRSAGVCKDIQGDMTSGKECLMRSGTLQSVYRDIVDHRLVRDANCLLKELPSADTSVKGCRSQSGLRQVKYAITSEAVEIDMEYAGGISTIELERKADGVRRKITYSAD